MLDDAGDDTRRVREKRGYGVVCSRLAGRTVVGYRRRHATPRLVVDVFLTAGEPDGCWFYQEKVNHLFLVEPTAVRFACRQKNYSACLSELCS